MAESRAVGIYEHHQQYFALYPAAWSSLNLARYDVVLSKKSGFCHGVHTRRQRKFALHICYCLAATPYVWTFDDYARSEGNFQGISVNTIMPWFVDLDADGDYDLVCGEGSTGAPRLHYFQNQGTPQLPQFVLITNDLVPGVFTWLSGMLVPATTDIDADGDQDLFISDSNGYIFFFENIGTPANFRFTLIDSNWQNLYAGYGVRRNFCFYDMDADGDQDLFINRDTYYGTPWEYNLRFYRNMGTPQNAQMDRVSCTDLESLLQTGPDLRIAEPLRLPDPQPSQKFIELGISR